MPNIQALDDFCPCSFFNFHLLLKRRLFQLSSLLDRCEVGEYPVCDERSKPFHPFSSPRRNSDRRQILDYPLPCLEKILGRRNVKLVPDNDNLRRIDMKLLESRDTAFVFRIYLVKRLTHVKHKEYQISMLQLFQSRLEGLDHVSRESADESDSV